MEENNQKIQYITYRYVKKWQRLTICLDYGEGTENTQMCQKWFVIFCTGNLFR